MGAYTLPREAFNLLVEAFGEKQKAEIFARAMEAAVDAIQEKAKEEIVEKKEITKIEIKEALTKELVTREIFEESMKSLGKVIIEQFKVVDERFKVVDERFKVVDERFKSLNFKLNIFIAIALLALTFANPAFVKLMERLF